MTNYIGIDPGLKGAIAAIDDDDNVLFLEDLPPILSMYTSWLITALADGREFIVGHEDVYGRPGQSCKANNTFMKAAGMSELVGRTYARNDQSFFKIAPATWKRHFGLTTSKDLSKTDKKHLSVDLARKLYPSVEKDLLYSKDGRAEALLIARYIKDVQHSSELQ